MRPVVASLLLITACGPANDDGSGCKDKMIAGDLVITEVFADFQAPSGGTGTDDGKEWFEIYNNTDNPIDLKGLTIVHSRPDDSKPSTHVMAEVTIAPGQYFTLGNATSDLVPAYVDYGYSADLGQFYNSDGGKLALKCGDSEIDSAVYDNVKSGHSRELGINAAPDYTLNDDQANWCEGDASPFEDGNFGTPGQENDCQPVVVGACSDNGTMRATVPPAVGDLVITELMPKPSAVSATVGQWFEAVAMADVDLNGVGLDRANDTNVKPQVIDSPDCVHVSAGSYVVFARSDDMTMNGGLPAPAATFSFSLNPSANADVQLVYGADVIDAVTWTTSTSGAALQLNPMVTDAASNDDPTNFCDATQVYDTVGAKMDLGTPGMMNTACAVVVQPGQCLDNGVARAIVPPVAGALVVNEIMGNPFGTGTDATQEWFEITNTGATSFDLNGLKVKGGSSTVNTVNSPDCKPVAGGGFATFAHSLDPMVNGGLPAATTLATFTFALSTSVTVFASDGTTVLDTGTVTSGADGKSKELMTTHTNTTDNDTTANWCDAATDQIYGTVTTNFGTPGAANVCP
ncbi:MAG: lamin tail domain-containing protein [Kofleriaceae bacterium]